MTSRLDDFSHHWRQPINRWRADGHGHTEKSATQQFWSDLFRCFGVIPERIDLFERDAARASTGRTGYIDLFWSGVVLGEAKSLGRDLDAAFDQALDYLAGRSIEQHEWPKYVIVSDFENIRLSRLDGNGWATTPAIDEPGSLQYLFLIRIRRRLLPTIPVDYKAINQIMAESKDLATIRRTLRQQRYLRCNPRRVAKVGIAR